MALPQNSVRRPAAPSRLREIERRAHQAADPRDTYHEPGHPLRGVKCGNIESGRQSHRASASVPGVRARVAPGCDAVRRLDDLLFYLET